jgi:putative oxidoreductase
MSQPLAQSHKVILVWLLRVGLTGIFGYAGLEKWFGAQAFVEQIANYQFLPELSAWAALFLPPIELAAACGLLILPHAWRLASALIMIALLLVFTLAMARAWSLGINIECGCFGKGSPTIGPMSFVRNFALILAAVTFMLLDRPVSPAQG